MPDALPQMRPTYILNEVKRLFVDITSADGGGARLGRYEVVERREDGSLLLTPESVDEVISQTSDRALTADEFLDALARLDAAASQHQR
jgi:hypothetical protein